jgi:hypothetical protein
MAKYARSPIIVVTLVSATLCTACAREPGIETGSIGPSTTPATALMVADRDAPAASVVVADFDHGRRAFKIQGAGPQATTSVQVAGWIAAELFCRNSHQQSGSRLRHARILAANKVPATSLSVEQAGTDMRFRCVPTSAQRAV